MAIIPVQTVRCEECGVGVEVPTRMYAQEREEWAQVAREKPATAMKLLRQYVGLNFTDCKHVVMHVAAAGESCRRCGARLPGPGEVVCQECKALNLNW